MIKIMKDCWYRNSAKLRSELEEKYKSNDLYDYCGYEELAKLTFGTIFNGDKYCEETLNLNKMTTIDDGDYQGTLLFTIPFGTYQPSAYEYLMTYIGYGSCSVCDALQHAFSCEGDTRISALFEICKDLICNAIKPYNHGWMHDPLYEYAEEDEEETAK